jgi:hypothetical protein
MDVWECPTCHTGQTGTHCTNPVCPDNPNVSDETKTMIRERHEQHVRDTAERDKLNALRNASYAGGNTSHWMHKPLRKG